jgi:hypothetical protein
MGPSWAVIARWDKGTLQLDKTIEFSPEENSATALPNDILVRMEQNRKYLYVALNGNDQVVKLDWESGQTVWKTKAGVAPYGLCLCHDKLYVTLWAGRMPESGDPHQAGVPWGKARTDPATAGVREGAVAILDPQSGQLLRTTCTGLHPNKIIASAKNFFMWRMPVVTR